MKKRLQQLLSLILTLLLLSTLLVLPAAADEPPVTIQVGGVTMASGEYLASGDTAVSTTQPDATTGYAYFEIVESVPTLTLHNYTYVGVLNQNDDENPLIAIKSLVSLHIILKGTNSVTSAADNYPYEFVSSGVYISGALNITGSGTLNAIGGGTRNSGYGGRHIYSYGVYATNSITIQDAEVNAKSGNSYSYASGAIAYSYGLYSDGAITVNGGTVTAKGETSNLYSYGIQASQFVITAGTVTVQGYSKAVNNDLTYPTAYYTATADATNYDGAGASDYVAANLASYKYLNFSPETYAITYDAGTGEGTVPTEGTKTYGEDYTVSTSYPLTKTGYTQIGWTTGSESTDGTGTVTTLTANAVATLYPVWVPTYAVSYNVGSGEGTVPAAETKTHGVDYTVSTSYPLTKTGYTQIGWKPDSESTDGTGAVTTLTENAAATLYPVWSRNSTGGESSGTTSGSATTTETTKNEDGSSTTTVTNKTTGTVTETTKYPDGSTVVTEMKKDGSVATTDKQVSGVTTVTKTDASGNTAASVTVPSTVKNHVTVTIPTDLGKTGGTVSVTVTDPDGKQKTVKGDYADGKINLPVSGSATIEILDDFVPLAALPFTDVAEGAWCHDAVQWAVAHDLFAGTSETTFAPNAPMTREMLWTVLGRLDGQTLKGSGVFDRAKGWASEQGITDGSNPNGKLSRQQLVTLLWRLAGSPTPSGNSDGFSDAGAVADYAKAAFAWAVENGIVAGSDGKLLPEGLATRAQVATMVKRYAQKIAK